MKAILWTGKRELSYCDISEPSPKKDWVKLKVLTCGYCATDYHIMTGALDICEPPHVLGHEICGKVVEVGEGVNPDIIGKRAVVETYVGCDDCEYCKNGLSNLCEAGEIGYPPLQGGEAEYVCVPRKCLHFLPDQVTDDEAGIMEAVVCPFGAIMCSDVKDKTVVVYGAGIAGLSFIQASKVFGAKKVIAVVRNDVKKEQALHFGADVVIDTRKEDFITRVKEETNGYGTDFFADATGVVKIIEEGFKSLRKGGKVILYGLPEKSAKISLSIFELILNQISFCGYTGNSEAWEKVIEATAQGKLNLKDMVTYSLDLKDTKKAVEMLDNKPQDMIKIVLHP